MILNKPLIIACSILTVFTVTSGTSMASGYQPGGHNTNYCTQTARTLYRACHFDTLDDFNETKANCINIIDDEAREECFDTVRSELGGELQSCKDQKNARRDVCDSIGEQRYADPLKDPNITFVDPDDIGEGVDPNPYVNMTVGHTYVLRAGEDFEETVVVHVTDEVREAEGYDGEPVLCRVVVDAVMILEEDEDEGTSEWIGEEVTDDYFAQDTTGIVYYCGEISRNYEDDYLVNLDGSFFSGVDHAKAGVLMRQAPAVGQVDRQEYAIAEAEDLVEYISLSAAPGLDEGGQNMNDPSFGCIGDGITEGDCLKTFDTSALDPESTEFKYYRAGVGFVLATSLEDGEFDGEREELLCVGDSLDVLSSCGLSEVEGLLEKLCELSPEAFCEDED